MNSTKDNWFYNLFIKEAKAVLSAHSCSGSGGSGGPGGTDDPNDPVIVLVDEYGNEMVATLVDEEVVFDATANDIREGKTAVTEAGVTIGTKEIPGYITTEGYKIIQPGEEVAIKLAKNRCEFTKLLAMICKFNTSVFDSVAAEMIVINDCVYAANSTELLGTTTVDVENGMINFGFINEEDTPYVVRFITLKEEY